MRNENRAVFDRASERCDYALELPLAPTSAADEDSPLAMEPSSPRSALSRTVRFVLDRLRRYRHRSALLELTDDQLKDIGISRSQAYGGYSRYRRSSAHGVERKCL